MGSYESSLGSAEAKLGLGVERLASAEQIPVEGSTDGPSHRSDAASSPEADAVPLTTEKKLSPVLQYDTDRYRLVRPHTTHL
ncbi:MAG: hypothetical protein R3F30_00355 [Planctomycetota bacterium]